MKSAPSIQTLLLEIATLKEEKSILEEQITQLKKLLINTDWEPPLELGLTPAEARLLGTLYSHNGLCRYDRLYHALYQDKMGDSRMPDILKVLMHRIRRKVAPYNVKVHTHYAEGFYLDAESRETLRKMTSEEDTSVGNNTQQQ